MRQKEGLQSAPNQCVFKDATIRRLIRAKLTHKQSVSSELVHSMNALLTQVFDSVALELDDYEQYPFPYLKTQHFDKAAKKWLLAKRWGAEKQALLGALKSIEGAAAAWRSAEEE